MSMKNKIIIAVSVLGFTSSVMLAQDASKIVVDGSTTVGPIAKAFAEYYMKLNPGVNITVSESGSGNGAKSLVNGVCDIATMSRAMKDKEKKSAEDAGRLPIANVVAMDGLAIVVHPSNPVKNITIEQVRKIYTGEIKNWKALGGPDKAIVVISRDTNSGTYETFESMVMSKQKIVDSAEYVGSNGAIRQRVSNTEGAVGYVGLAFLEGVKTVSVENIEPTPENINSKKYPISRPLYMYTNGKPKEGTHLCNFLNLYKAKEGKKIIDDLGYVSIN